MGVRCWTALAVVPVGAILDNERHVTETLRKDNERVYVEQ